jgi:UDP-N-acetylglucosamine 1-carboxyvinyltransferase
MGAELELRDGYVHAEARGGLKGAVVEFPIVSVGATENALMAATLAKGTTILKNRRAGARDRRSGAVPAGNGGADRGRGHGRITIQGVDRLHGATHPVVIDRIELGTYMLAPAIAGGEVELLGGGST